MDADWDEQIRASFADLASLASRVADELAEPIAKYAHLVAESLAEGGTVFFCGNGGSAADAQHLATEYVVRLDRDRGAMAAVALTTDTSLLTAAANDFGFAHVFARQIEALGRTGDVLVLHSTSGESENLLRAVSAARDKGLRSIGVLAKGGGRLLKEVDISVVVPTNQTSRAQEIQIAVGHVVCGLVETRLAAADSKPSTGVGTLKELLLTLREEEKKQTLFYRALAAEAEIVGDADASERLNGLLADEQHHFSRLTARLIELGETPADLYHLPRPQLQLHGWKASAGVRELKEVAAYEAALTSDLLDPKTAEVLQEILDSERHHLNNLGGKWMSA